MHKIASNPTVCKNPLSECNICSIGSLGEIVTGKTPSTSRQDYFGGDIPFVSPADFDGQRYISQTQTTLTDEGAKRVRMLPPNTILVTCIGMLGKVGQAETPLATNQQINSIIPNDKLYPAYGFWAAHLLKSQLEVIAGIQAVPIVNKRLFSQLLLPCPSLSEQRAIAHVLDTLETQIQQTEKLIAKLKQVKAGLLHDLLTYGIDENGEVRDPVTHPEKFNDTSRSHRSGASPISANLRSRGRQGQAQPLQYGTPPGAAERLIDVGTGLAPAFGPIDACTPKFVPMGASPDGRACPDGLVSGRIPRGWKIDHLINHISLPSGQVDPKKQPYCNWALIAPDHIEPATGRLLHVQTALEQNATSGKYCFQPHDVLYSKIRPHLRKAVLANDEGLCSADMYPLRPRNTITPRFLFALVLSESFSRFATAVSARSGFPKINRKELAEYTFALPPYEEQMRISKLLEAQDIRITIEEANFDKLRQIKKGLIHDLLTRQVCVTELVRPDNS